MSLTFEYRTGGEMLENKEWDRYWIESARDCTTSRIWMIGDSITNGIMETFNDIMDYPYPVDGYVTSKSIDNPYLIPMIELFSRQQRYRNVIIFNNGLHGWHLNDTTDYAAYYEKTVAFLVETYPETPLFLSLCTHLQDAEMDKRVVSRNNVIHSVAKKFNLPVIDHYTIVKNNPDLLCRDGVHLTSYRLLCNEITRNISLYL